MNNAIIKIISILLNAINNDAINKYCSLLLIIFTIVSNL